MNGQKWYPAAALSAFLLGCGGSSDTQGGGTPAGTGGIDGGVPAAVGGQMVAYYGVLINTGGTAGVGTVNSTVGGTGVGGMMTAIPMYGPRFAEFAPRTVSTGGSQNRGHLNAEGGAQLGSDNPELDPERCR